MTAQEQVLADLLAEAFDIIATVEPESDTEGAMLALLLDRMATAIRHARAQQFFEVDAAKFKLT